MEKDNGLVEVECANTNCKKIIVVQKAAVRNEMFCTLGCLNASKPVQGNMAFSS